jgi:hypothetical protein
MKGQPHDWRILLNGKTDEMEYEQGELAVNLPFPERMAIRSSRPAYAKAARFWKLSNALWCIAKNRTRWSEVAPPRLFPSITQ